MVALPSEAALRARRYRRADRPSTHTAPKKRGRTDPDRRAPTTDHRPTDLHRLGEVGVLVLALLELFQVDVALGVLVHRAEDLLCLGVRRVPFVIGRWTGAGARRRRSGGGASWFRGPFVVPEAARIGSRGPSPLDVEWWEGRDGGGEGVRSQRGRDRPALATTAAEPPPLQAVDSRSHSPTPTLSES